MKTISILLLVTAGLGAQSLAVTSPANGAVVTYGFPLTATLTSLPGAVSCRFYIDGRLEGITNQVLNGTCSLPKMKYATFSDERAATIYAEAYNSLNTLLATSATNTFRIDNTGVNAVMTVNCGSGTVPNGGTVTGTCTAAVGKNATISGTVIYPWNIDGFTNSSPQVAYGLNSTVSTTTGAITVPVMYFHQGDQVTLSCLTASRVAVSGGLYCTNGDNDLPAGWNTIARTLVYAEVCGPNCIQISHTPGGPPIVPTTQGVTTEYTQISPWGQDWGGGPSTPFPFDSTYWPNGLHRIEEVLEPVNPGTWNVGASFTLPASAITTSTGSVVSTNFPLAPGQAVTCSGTCPAQWGGTLYTVVEDANDFCLAASAANAQNGICITSLSGASGTLTLNFTIPSAFDDTTSGYLQLYGTDIQEFTFSNGNAPMALKTKYSRIVGIAGDTFTLAPYYLNCDGSTTALAANHPVYSTSDSTRATVSSSGVVTLGSTNGHALISVVDALSATNGRSALIEVEVRPDRTTYQHMSRGYGILNSYNPAKSVVAIVPFNSTYNSLLYNPFPVKYLRPAFTALRGLTFDLTLDATSSFGNSGSLANWLSSYWNQPASSFLGLAFAQQIAAQIAPMLSYGGTSDICHGYQAYRMYADTWRQQVLSRMYNDLAPYLIGSEWCDEMTTRFGNMIQPRGDMGSGQDGLGHTTLGGQTAGLTSVVISGCAATPCAATATFNLRSWPQWLSEGYLQVQGATTCAQLNGPILGGNPTYGYDNGIGVYLTSFTATVYDITNQTCTDPGMALAVTAEGNDYNGPFVSATGAGPNLSQTGYQLGGTGGPAQASCASNVCTFSWTGHPFTFTGQVAHLSGFSTSGLNGYWRATVIDANDVSVRVASVANGTYSNSTNSAAYVDAMAYLPQTFIPNLFSTYFTGNHTPLGGSIVGGYNTGIYSWGSWEGSNLTQMVIQNSNPFAWDRYGGLISQYRNQYRQGGSQALVDGTLPINLIPTTKPYLYEAQFNGQTCAKFVQTSDCRTDQTPGDLIDSNPTWNGTVFMSSLFPWCCLPNGAGSLPYQYASPTGSQRVPPGPYAAPGSPNFQTPPNEVDLFPDQWLAMVSVSLWAQHEDKYLLQPLLSSPDENVGPGPYPQIECQSHTGSYGNSLICANLSEERQTATFDLSMINPGGAGGPMRRWNLSAFGDTVTELSPSTTSDTQTLLYGQAVMYISQAAGTADDLKTINVPLTLAYSATNAVLEIHYYLNDEIYQTVNCGTGACPPIAVNLHNLDVYMRKRFTQSNGAVVMTGDLERLPSQ